VGQDWRTSPRPSPRRINVVCWAMPRAGALTLSDVHTPTLAIVCDLCARRGRYNVARLMAKYGDGNLTDLFVTLASCPKAPAASVSTAAGHVSGARSKLMGLHWWGDD
jgi:hypothetical protein